MITVQDWAQIRYLHGSEQLSVRAIASLAGAGRSDSDMSQSAWMASRRDQLIAQRLVLLSDHASEFHPRIQAELLKYSTQVTVDGVMRKVHLSPRLLVGQPASHKFGDGSFGVSKLDPTRHERWINRLCHVGVVGRWVIRSPRGGTPRDEEELDDGAQRSSLVPYRPATHSHSDSAAQPEDLGRPPAVNYGSPGPPP